MSTVSNEPITADDQTVKNLERDDRQSNLDGAADSSGFHISSPIKELKREGISTKAGGNDIYRERDKTTTIHRIDEENPDQDFGGEEIASIEDIDWDDLMIRWARLGLPVEDFPEKRDRGGRDALFEANQVLKRIQELEVISEDSEVDGDQIEGYEYHGQNEDTKTVDPETLTGIINVTLNPGFIMQENAIGYLQGKLTPQDLIEIWNTTSEVVIKLDEDGDPKIAIKSTSGKGLNLSLEDFFRMTRTEIDGKSYGLETPEIGMTDQEEPKERYLDIRPVETLLNRLNVNGKPLGGDNMPNIHYTRDKS